MRGCSPRAELAADRSKKGKEQSRGTLIAQDYFILYVFKQINPSLSTIPEKRKKKKKRQSPKTRKPENPEKPPPRKNPKRKERSGMTKTPYDPTDRKRTRN